MFVFSLTVFIGLLHYAIAAVELFFWRNPKVHNRLDYDQITADKVAPIVANAGLYNAFIGSGLLWSLSSSGCSQGIVFFLVCVFIAGVFGGLTLKWTTLVLQSIPAAIALCAIYFSPP